jgi:biopolymer transport protein ExbB
VISILLISFCFGSVSLGQEVPQGVPQIPQQETAIQPIDEAQQQADLDADKAREEAALKEAEILYQEGTLKARVGEIEEERKAQEKLLKSLDKQYQENDKEIDRLQKRMEEQQGEANEIAGTVHGLAQDLGSVLRQSIVSVEISGRQAVLEPLLSETEFPSLENIQQMSELFFEEIEQNGKIAVNSLSFVDRSGKKTSGEVIRVGVFNALFSKDGAVGYLEYSPSKQAFHQLTIDPPGSMIRSARKFIQDGSQNLFVDLSGGGAFRQLTEKPTWLDELKSGGILVYPIVGLGLIALILIIERFLLLYREGRYSEALSKEITPLMQNGKWEKALEVCTRKGGSLAQVLESGINHRHEHTEIVESVISEKIQSSLPLLERNMSALQILGMVSPLMGLLGTVTGMIATFQMITLYGTGDPKIMSGGISEALVTTEYGLIVAIPIILAHGYLQGKIDGIINTLEEKAITLVNAIKTSDKDA